MDNEKIYVTQPSMPSYEEYIEAIKPLWDSHWLTNMGIYHKQLEKELGVMEMLLYSVFMLRKFLILLKAARLHFRIHQCMRSCIT